jgi:glycosyltransferase involved in cell wall biosynthesis
MNVGIEASVLGSGRGGDETYLTSLLEGLAAVADDESDRFPVYVRSGAPTPPSIVGRAAFPVRVVPARGPLRYALTLPVALARESVRIDVLHSILHAPLYGGVPRAVMITDLSFRHHPDFYRLHTRLRLDVLIPMHVRQARVVMTLSEFCKRDLINTYGIPAEKVFVVPVGIAPPSRRDASSARSWLATRGIDGPFFLYVGNLQPRKNLPRLIEAFLRARGSDVALDHHRLLIVGAPWRWGGQETLTYDPDSVRFIGRVTDDERDFLMAAADALVYPSIFEGFGLPPLEAMAVGTPVIASNTSAMPEILGDAALLVDPLDVSAIARALVRVASEPGLRAQLSERGRARVASFTFRRTAESALAAFTAAASPQRDAPHERHMTA